MNYEHIIVIINIIIEFRKIELHIFPRNFCINSVNFKNY